MDNANTKDYLDKIRAQVVENLKRTAFAPSVQMTDVPRDPLVDGMDDEADAILDDLDEDENKDKRYTKRRFDQYIEKPGELSDSDDEEETAANGVRPQPNVLKRRNQINYRGLDTADSGIESGLATPNEPSSVADDDLDTAGDTRMGEAPEPGTGSPSAAEPESRAEEASGLEATDATMGGQEEPASTAISRQPSPGAQGEDTTMEDVQAPLEVADEKEPEPAELEQAEEKEQPEQPQAELAEAPTTEPAQVESKPEEATAPETAAEPTSAPKAESPKEAPEPAVETAKSPEPAKEPVPVETEQEPPKEAAPEKPEESSKQEE